MAIDAAGITEWREQQRRERQECPSTDRGFLSLAREWLADTIATGGTALLLCLS